MSVKEVFRIIVKNLPLLIVLTLLGFVIPLIFVHVLFKFAFDDIFFRAIFRANWSAGEALAFFISFESVLATGMLGYASYYANRNAQKNNERLSREYNHLQEIAIQRLLPVFRISAWKIEPTVSGLNAEKFDEFPRNAMQALRRSSQGKHSDVVRVFLHNGHNDGFFVKKIHLTLENISEGIIREIRFDRIAFSGGKLPDNDEEICFPECTGTHEHNSISGLWAPTESLNFCIELYFCDEQFEKFWTYLDKDRLGAFDICLYMTNTTIAGVQFHEKVYIKYSDLDRTEKIMYDTFEADADEHRNPYHEESHK